MYWIDRKSVDGQDLKTGWRIAYIPIKLRLPIILPNCAKVLSFCSSSSVRNRLGLEGIVENPAQLNFSGGV